MKVVYIKGNRGTKESLRLKFWSLGFVDMIYRWRGGEREWTFPEETYGMLEDHFKEPLAELNHVKCDRDNIARYANSLGDKINAYHNSSLLTRLIKAIRNEL